MKKDYQNKKKSSFSSLSIFAESGIKSIEKENEESPKFKENDNFIFEDDYEKKEIVVKKPEEEKVNK